MSEENTGRQAGRWMSEENTGRERERGREMDVRRTPKQRGCTVDGSMKDVKIQPKMRRD